MKTGIIGSASVGQALAKGFMQEGHDVMLGTRNQSKPEVVQFAKDNPNIKTGTFEEAAKFGDILVLAVAGNVAQEAMNDAGTDNFRNKVVIDVTNPIANEPPENGVLKFFTNINFSLMEELQRVVPEAKFVKAFNSVGNNLMYKPSFNGTKPTMFIAGNDEAAKATVTKILDSFGWETADMGKAEGARAIEPLCILWCIPGMLRNEWTGHAFKLLQK
jgi:predicted dinucleotide-binding enzyme